MARTNSVNFTGGLQFPMADAATDLFKKEDVQVAAKALDQHDHTTGKGLPLPAGAIPNGTITSAMIADGTIDTADLKDSAVTSLKIADGTIATADLANNAVTNAKLGTDTARISLLTNGSFDVWQRGNGPFTANSAFGPDRWAIYLASGDTLSVSRDTSNTDGPAGACAACTYTRSTGLSRLYQPFRKSDGYAALGNRTVTLSLRVRTSTPNAVRAAIETDGTGGTTTYSNYHTGGGTYETLTVTATVPSDYTSIYLQGNFNASCTAYLDNAMLVVGSVAADYAPLHPADDLARCERYYELTASGNSEWQVTGMCYSATQAVFPKRWRIQKSVVPTVTYSPAANWAVMLNTTADANLTAISTLGSATVFGVGIQATTASGLVAGQATILKGGGSAVGQIYAEANP